MNCLIVWSLILRWDTRTWMSSKSRSLWHSSTAMAMLLTLAWRSFHRDHEIWHQPKHWALLRQNPSKVPYICCLFDSPEKGQLYDPCQTQRWGILRFETGFDGPSANVRFAFERPPVLNIHTYAHRCLLRGFLLILTHMYVPVWYHGCWWYIWCTDHVECCMLYLYSNWYGQEV